MLFYSLPQFLGLRDWDEVPAYAACLENAGRCKSSDHFGPIHSGSQFVLAHGSLFCLVAASDAPKHGQPQKEGFLFLSGSLFGCQIAQTFQGEAKRGLFFFPIFSTPVVQRQNFCGSQPSPELFSFLAFRGRVFTGPANTYSLLAGEQRTDGPEKATP